MEVTSEQRHRLLTTNRTADHMFPWVYNVLNSDKISRKQYNVLIKIHDMDPTEQKGYIIHEDTLYPVPTKVKKFQKLTTGWTQTTRYITGQYKRKRPRKDK
jgi:hypothetical protein